jgi:acyl carrier protein
MDQTEVYKRLQGVFDRTFMEPVLVSPTLTAEEVEEWDSLTHVSLVLAVEEEFGIRFRVGEVEATKNVGDFAALIEKKEKDRRG